MNAYDTELVRSILAEAGYVFVPTEDEADVVMLNTCSVRENANRKVYGRIHAILHKRQNGHKDTKTQGHKPVIGILGCMATNLRKGLLEDRHLGVDFIAGPDSYKRLPELIEETLRAEGRGTRDEGRKNFDVTLSEFETYPDVYPARERGVNAWIAVMRGCNNFCTFCVVPYTRGRERSRSVLSVVEETKRLAGEGFKQVTLLGQNVNSYFHDSSDFADLLEAVSGVNGIERVRFTSPHPKDFPDKLLTVVAGNPKVCKHVHLPLQAGSDRILTFMNRTYTQAEFLMLVDKIRRAHPAMALTTDIIIGFPSETGAEFEDTFRVVKDVEFDSAFIFKYSQRRGTIAEREFPDDVPEEAKTERIVRLNDLQKEISLKKNRAHIGQAQEILIESHGTKRSAREFQGRNDANKLVTLSDGDYAIGQMVRCEITGASAHTLKGVAK
jgi:tRNA-2-methylthio-N6-dimethylallyladenosine synthase